MAFLNILFVIFDFGFGFYIQREFSRSNDAEYRLNEIVYFRVYMFILYSGIIFLYDYFFPSGNLLLLFLLSVPFYVNGFNNILIKVIHGKGDYKVSFRPFVYSRIVFAAVLTVFLFYSDSVPLLASIFLTSSFIEFVLLSKIIGLRNILSLKRKVNLKNIYSIYKVSYPFALGMISVVLYDKIDVLFIKEILSPVEVSFYSVAYSFYKLPALIPPVFLVPLYTEMSKFYQEKQKINFKAFRSTLLILSGFSLLVLGLYTISGGFFIDLFFGDRFISSSGLLKILSIGFIFLVLNNLTGVTLNSINKEKYQLAGTISGVVVNIVLNVIMLPKIGIYGAVISTISAEFTVLLIQSVPLVSLYKNKL